MKGHSLNFGDETHLRIDFSIHMLNDEIFSMEEQSLNFGDETHLITTYVVAFTTS